METLKRKILQESRLWSFIPPRWEPLIRELLDDPEQRAGFFLAASLGTNLLYALFKLLAGKIFQSPWMAALGVYYGLLAIMRFLLLRRMKQNTVKSEWKAYRNTAVLLLVLTLIIAGIIAQTFLLPKTYDYPGVLIYAFTAYAFGKMISVSVSLARKRHAPNRILAAARCISFAQALMSILAVQVALINRFGADSPGFTFQMNSLLGAAICLLVIGMSFSMLAKAGKALASM